EVQGIEGDTILLQEVFRYQNVVNGDGERSTGELVPTGLRPHFLEKLAESGIEIPASTLRSRPPPASSATRGRVTRVPSHRRLADIDRSR
ncbi:MAG: pilus assembly protein CpaF, partial [Gaiellales bacterium]|nr:pilus assembly protein CpaF [Gaiellales bacterium]